MVESFPLLFHQSRFGRFGGLKENLASGFIGRKRPSDVVNGRFWREALFTLWPVSGVWSALAGIADPAQLENENWQLTDR